MNFTESNIWFYTLSTIAQTCAAIIALGGTFVIFKLDKVKTAIDNYRGRVVKIVQVWRRGTKQPDKFYDESDKDILDQYRKIVADNKEDIFDISDITELYKQFEGVRLITCQEGLTGNGVKLDNEEKKRWCNRMADLLENNIKLSNRIYYYLRITIILLTTSIILSIGLLISKPLNLPVGIKTLIFVAIFAIISISYSAHAVWEIAKSKPIL